MVSNDMQTELNSDLEISSCSSLQFDETAAQLAVTVRTEFTDIRIKRVQPPLELALRAT
jgi:hypothetical protein